MDEYIEITTSLCHENGCNDVILKLPKTEVMKLQSSVISDNPPLGKFDMNILGAGVAFVLTFYVLGYALGRMIKMVN